MTNVNGKPWVFNNNDNDPPPPSRYDILTQQAAIILPSVAVAYSITPDLDIGGRFSAGTANLKSSVAVWGLTNFEEWQQEDSLFSINANAFLVTGAFGVAYRPTKNIELGANYTLPIDVNASGTATNENGPAVNLNGAPVFVNPVPNAMARCAPNGTAEELKACVSLVIPMTAQLGGRWKFLDAKGALRGDLELNVGWENWGAGCNHATDPTCVTPSDYRVVVDAEIDTSKTGTGSMLDLQDQLIRHGFQDTYDVRVGGSYNWPVAGNTLIARGGISYDTAAASDGWERVDVDGMARTMFAAGASYKWTQVEVDAGLSYIYEGTLTQNRNCVTTGSLTSMGCGPGGTEENPPGFGLPGPFRQGPDPINPIVSPLSQLEQPINEGTFKSSYFLFMLGAEILVLTRRTGRLLATG